MPGRKTYNQIWPVLPSSGDTFFEVSALQVSDVIAFCPVLLPSTVYTVPARVSHSLAGYILRNAMMGAG